MASELSDANLDFESFRAIADLTYRESGLQLVSEKSSMIQSRLRHRLRALGVNGFAEYANFVCSERGVDERRHMISALTTNVSHFFREKHHFEMLVKDMMPQLIDKIRNGAKARIWSAGCSNGQEAYSIAISLLDHFPDLAHLDCRILATDIDPKVISFGKQASYPQRLVSGVPDNLLKKFFTKSMVDGEIRYDVCSDIQSMVVFKELNILSTWPMKQAMDAIFCRNVVIYFDSATQNSLWPRFRNQLADHGCFFLGHSERITKPESLGFANHGPTTYRAITATAHSEQRA